MSMKPIAVLAGMLAMLATLTAAHAVPTAGGTRPAAVRQDGSLPLSLLILTPRQHAVG
jgi:hypothetical protein